MEDRLCFVCRTKSAHPASSIIVRLKKAGYGSTEVAVPACEAGRVQESIAYRRVAALQLAVVFVPTALFVILWGWPAAVIGFGLGYGASLSVGPRGNTRFGERLAALLRGRRASEHPDVKALVKGGWHVD